MRANFCLASTATGGTGALTLASVTGYPNPKDAGLIPNQTVEYTIIEYSGAARASAPAKCEVGYGTLSSAGVLTRSYATSTWDGSTYDDLIPAFLSFGTSNVEVMFGPVVESFGIPRSPGKWIGSNAQYFTGANLDGVAAVTSTADRIHALPMLMLPTSQFTSMGVRVITGLASDISIALCSIDPLTGGPGTVLLSNGAAPLSGAVAGHVGVTSATTGAGLPANISPGWYWGLVHTTTGVSLRGGGNVGGNILAPNGTAKFAYTGRASGTVSFTVGSAWNANFTETSAGSRNIVTNNNAPFIYFEAD